ncbi:unnamed protein product, partial [Gadus morhua 'NCC']
MRRLSGWGGYGRQWKLGVSLVALLAAHKDRASLRHDATQLQALLLSYSVSVPPASDSSPSLHGRRRPPPAPMSFSPGVNDPSGASVIQEQRDRWARKRSRVARELVLTEQRYCQQLELVNTYFVEILKAKETLRPSVVESVFSSIKAIHSVNQSLLVHVENGYLGRGFEQFCPQLPHYNVYVDNMYDARKVLAAQLKKNRGFRRYKALQEARPEFRDCKLEDLLNLPAQRIHQYKHYLQDLTETTSPEDPEFQQLSGAARAVSEVSCRIQDNARSHQNHLQLLRVQRLLKGRRTKVLAP